MTNPEMGDNVKSLDWKEIGYLLNWWPKFCKICTHTEAAHRTGTGCIYCRQPLCLNFDLDPDCD